MKESKTEQEVKTVRGVDRPTKTPRNEHPGWQDLYYLEEKAKVNEIIVLSNYYHDYSV